MKRTLLTISIVLLVSFSANGQSRVDRGFVHDGTYINSGFGFSYKHPKDWVVHGDATVDRIKEIGKEKAVEAGVLSKSSAEVAVKNSHYLLTVFRHAVGTPGITFNPAVVVLAENVAHAPGVTNGKDYLLNLRTLLLKANHQVLQKEPAEIRFGGWQFFRDNYAVDVNGVPIVQAYFASITKGYALVFIFMGEDEKSVDEMAKSMETFAQAPPIRRGVTTIAPAPKPKPN